jgi:transcriptional regulator with XRE-family HTH domain
MNHFRDLLNDLEKHDESPTGLDLRLDLAEVILSHLDGKKWTQARLADAAGMKASYLTRITHSAQNCTFEVADRIASALGVKLKLVAVPQFSAGGTIVGSSHTDPLIIRQENTNGQAQIQDQEIQSQTARTAVIA